MVKISDAESDTENENTDSDRDEYDSVTSEESIDVEDTEKKIRLLEEKLKLILRYNGAVVDLDEYKRAVFKVNEELEDLSLAIYADENLVNLEYNLLELFTEYSRQIKQGAKPDFLKDEQINELNRILSQMKRLINQEIEEKTNDDYPLDSRSLDDIFEDLLKEETKYLKTSLPKINKILLKLSKVNKAFKNYPSKIVLPKRQDYKTEQEFDEAYKNFYRIVGKFIQNEKVSQSMNVTSIGSTYDKFEKSIKQQFLEETELYKKLAIKVPAQDLEFANKRLLLKQIMNKLELQKLIECATSVEVFLTEQNMPISKIDLSPIEIQKIKKYYESAKKTEAGLVITPSLRTKMVQDLTREFGETGKTLMKSLETEIYILTQPDFIKYTSKINDVLFIFTNYPNFKKYLLDSKLTVNQLALFEKELAFETVLKSSTVKNRRSTIKHIKSVLLQKKFYPNPLVNNYKSNVVAKRLELLIFDISNDEKEYNKFVDRLIQFIKTNNPFKQKIETVLVAIIRETVQKKREDYSDLTSKEIFALISQTRLSIDSILSRIKLVKRDIQLWKCPKNVLKNEQTKWQNLVKKGNIDKMIVYRKYLIKKYSLLEDRRLIELKQRLKHENEKYNLLKGYSKKLKKNEEKHYDQPDYPQIVYGQITFTKNEKMINELIQLYKRKLMIDSLKISLSDKNKLIDLLELIDINDILLKNQRLQTKLLVDINGILPEGYNFFDFNRYYYTLALQSIQPFLNETTITFTRNESGLLDFYGDDIFNKLYNSNNPEDLYQTHVQRHYYRLIENVKIKTEEVYRRLRILYNPYTGKFGKEAYDGYLFEVEKLRKGNDGKPLEDYTVNESIDPRTNQMVYEKIKIPVPGNDPFIKVPILTVKKNEQKFVWVPVQKEQTQMFANNYDSCSRFDNNQTDCNTAKGLGNSVCEYNVDTFKCMANYSKNAFGISKIKTDKLIKKLNKNLKYCIK
jgi:hypothetical protein